MSKTVIAAGADAIRKTVEILAELDIAKPKTPGLRPGAQWRGDRMLLSVRHGFIHFVAGSTLYEQDQEGFLRTEFPVRGTPPPRASWLRGMLQHEMAFCMGLAGELQLAWPDVSSACALLDRFSHYHRNHRTRIEAAARDLRFVAEALLALQFWPAHFATVMDSLGECSSRDLPKGLTPFDLGAFLGRLLIGTRHDRITLPRVADCVRTLCQPPTPPAADILEVPHYRRMLEALERSSESVAPILAQLSRAL